MNITKTQLKQLRGILRKENKEIIAKQAGMSLKSVEAVLQGTRRNDVIERLIVNHAEDNLADFENTLCNVKSKNREDFISVEGYENALESVGWARGNNYYRHIDVYLQISHLKLNSIEDLWSILIEQYRDVLKLDYYCVEIIRRAMGIAPAEALNFYNRKIQ